MARALQDAEISQLFWIILEIKNCKTKLVQPIQDCPSQKQVGLSTAYFFPSLYYKYFLFPIFYNILLNIGFYSYLLPINFVE